MSSVGRSRIEVGMPLIWARPMRRYCNGELLVGRQRRMERMKTTFRCGAGNIWPEAVPIFTLLHCSKLTKSRGDSSNKGPERASARRRKRYWKLLTHHLPNIGTDSGNGVETMAGEQSSRGKGMARPWGRAFWVGAEAYEMPPYPWNPPLQRASQRALKCFFIYSRINMQQVS